MRRNAYRVRIKQWIELIEGQKSSIDKVRGGYERRGRVEAGEGEANREEKNKKKREQKNQGPIHTGSQVPSHLGQSIQSQPLRAWNLGLTTSHRVPSMAWMPTWQHFWRWGLGLVFRVGSRTKLDPTLMP